MPFFAMTEFLLSWPGSVTQVAADKKSKSYCGLFRGAIATVMCADGTRAFMPNLVL